MAKFCDVVGYAETRECRPGIWEETITERPYYGDVLRNTRRLEGADTINGDVALNNRISIVADPYAFPCHSIREVDGGLLESDKRRSPEPPSGSDDWRGVQWNDRMNSMHCFRI